ncbi:MAG: hydrolase, partial [Bacillota bacterium]
ISGLPYLRKAWPDLVSLGAAYGEKVLEKDSALKQIRILSEVAWEQYTDQKKPYVLMDGLKIDQMICEKDVILLGDRELHCYETPGHTNCSLSFLLEPGKIFFPSESTGVYSARGMIYTGMLKSYHDTVAAIEKCRKIKINHIISPHYGLVSDDDREAYWDLSLASTEESKKFILEKKKDGALFSEILEEYTKEFWIRKRTEEQPKEAFLLNAHHMIHNVLKEFHEV